MTHLVVVALAMGLSFTAPPEAVVDVFGLAPLASYQLTIAGEIVERGADSVGHMAFVVSGPVTIDGPAPPPPEPLPAPCAPRIMTNNGYAFTTGNAEIRLWGLCSLIASEIVVNGTAISYTPQSMQWECVVPLAPGANRMTVLARNATGASAPTRITVTREGAGVQPAAQGGFER